VRREVNPDARYAWFREFTDRDATADWKRTHYHSVWSLDDDEQAARCAGISNDVWGRITGATSEKAHGWKRVYDAGGLARYISGLVGHHLKETQMPYEQWRGRRFGTSRGFYAIDTRELDKLAKAIVRDDRLVHHLEREMASDAGIPDGLPIEIWDDVLTDRFEAAKQRPAPRLVRLSKSWSW
jgi:hypothetical protein